MRKVAFILISSLFLFNCNLEKTKLNTNEVLLVKKNVNEILNKWHKAATDANFENYFSKMDTVGVFIGTDAGENWNIKEFKAFCKPYFDKGKAWDFKTLERNIYINNTGDFVWFDELLATWMGTCRGSGVLEKIDNTWKVKHYVLSVAIPNDDIQAVVKAKKKNDSIFLTKFN